MSVLRFPTRQFRSIPPPTGSSRIGVFFTGAAQVPDELWKWRAVNPREVNKRSRVYKAIYQTLTQEPERFHERNRGITIVADELDYDEKRHEVILPLSDNKVHGVVDGAHTLQAILEAQNQPPEGDWPAFVFVKIVVGVEADQIAEIAGGLNTSQQVDLKSLENLREHFRELQASISGQPYANNIAYKMNEDKPIDVREVLYYLAVFDCDEYDQKHHPVALYGRKEGIVRRFAAQAADNGAGDSFKVLISKAHEILRLRDLIEKRALKFPVGRYKTGKDTSGTERHQPRKPAAVPQRRRKRQDPPGLGDASPRSIPGKRQMEQAGGILLLDCPRRRTGRPVHRTARSGHQGRP